MIWPKLKMNWLKSKKIVITHNGPFHPDDVFAVASLSVLLNGKIKIIRTRDEVLYSKGDFVVDTGNIYDPNSNRFDHHQEGNAGFRDNKIPYSAFGLVWQKYGEQICGSKKVADILDKKLVQIIDADDCNRNLYSVAIEGVRPFFMTDLIYALKLTWKEDISKIDDHFLKAVDLAKSIILRQIKLEQDKIEAETLVDEIYRKSEDKRVVIFDGYYLPKGLLLKYPEPLFVVYKDMMRKMWRVGTIDKDETGFGPRKNFPQAWWGKRDKDLADVSGIPDAVFCRNGGIFLGVTSKENAIKMAKMAIETKE